MQPGITSSLLSDTSPRGNNVPDADSYDLGQGRFLSERDGTAVECSLQDV
jgi:hypothetical protein